jgi:hypothetical protein
MSAWVILKRTNAGLFPHGATEADDPKSALLNIDKQNVEDGGEYVVVREDCMHHFSVDLKVTVEAA